MTTDKERDYMKKVSYSSVVGNLIYIMVCTSLDLVYIVSVVIRFTTNLIQAHWEVAKWIIRYLKRTDKICLVYGANILNNCFISYVDSNHRGNLLKRI